MKVLRTYRYKLQISSQQRQQFYQWLGCCRLVYNLSLHYKKEGWETAKKTISRFDLQKKLLDWKQEKPFLKTVHSQVLQEVILRLDKTYKKFFQGGGFPKFAKKGIYRSLTFPQSVGLVGERSFFLPKVGIVKILKDRLPEGLIKQATLVEECGNWYLCVSSEEAVTSLPANENQVGLDMGVTHFATTSAGKFIANPAFLKVFSRKLRLLQRSLARKKKGSYRYKKEKYRLAKVYQRLRYKRADFLHKESTSLIKRYGSIVAEDLDLENMTRSAKGTKDNPGKMVRQKAGLNRRLLDVSIGSFISMLSYKSSWYGRYFEKVDPRYSSQTCSQCGYKDKGNRKTQARFVCLSCGYSQQADLNAAKNIRRRGHRPGAKSTDNSLRLVLEPHVF